MTSPVDVVDDLGAFYVGLEESAFGTASANFQRAFPIMDSLVIARQQTQLDVKNLHVTPHNIRAPIKSFKSGTAKLSYLVQPHTESFDTDIDLTAMGAGTTVPPLFLLLFGVLGGLEIHAGSTVATGTSTTVFDVQSGHGARFPAGTLILVTDHANGLVPCRVTDRTGDTITVWPALSAAPATDAPVINGANCYLNTVNTKSLSLRYAHAGDSNYQQELLGVTGSLALKLERGGLGQFDFDLKAATYNGPDGLGFSSASAADSMGEPFAIRGAKMFLQARATGTRVSYPVESVGVTVNTGNEHLETLVGGTEGIRGVMRTAGLYDPGAKIEIVMRADRDIDNTWYDSRTELSAFFWVEAETSVGRQVFVVDAPTAYVREVPSFEKGANNLVKTKIMLDCMRDKSTTGTNAQATAPIRFGLLG